MAISTVVTAGVAWGISFWVADYIAQAHSEAVASSFSGVEASLSRNHEAILDNGQAIFETQTRLSDIQRSGEVHALELSNLQQDFTRLAVAVQDYGITVRIGLDGTPQGSFVNVPYTRIPDVIVGEFSQEELDPAIRSALEDWRRLLEDGTEREDPEAE